MTLAPLLNDVIRTHWDFVARILARAGVADRDLPDLRQEVFIVVHRRLHEFEGRARISTWLCRIALNVASDHRRRAYQRRELLDTASEAADHDCACSLERRELFEHFVAALETLSDDKRTAFLQYEFEELSMRQIAERAGVPLKTAFSRLYAARRELGARLRKEGVVLGLLPIGWPARRWHATRLRKCLPFASRMPALGAITVSCLFLLAPLALPPHGQHDATVRPRRLPLMAADSTEQSPTRAQCANSVVAVTATEQRVDGHAERTLRRRRSEVPASVAVAAQQPPPSDDADFRVYRTGAEEVLPPTEYPFGFELQPQPVRPAAQDARRIAYSPQDAADAVENALR